MVTFRRTVGYSIVSASAAAAAAALLIFLLSLSSPVSSASPDIHDILPEYNIPKGIVPDAVKSYSFSPSDSSFSVEMLHPCYVKFVDDQLVYYDKLIKGKLTFGKITQVSGIEAKKLFFWVPVTGLDVNSDSGTVEFHVGVISQSFPLQQFQDIPSCIKNKQPCQSLSLKIKSFWPNYL